MQEESKGLGIKGKSWKHALNTTEETQTETKIASDALKKVQNGMNEILLDDFRKSYMKITNFYFVLAKTRIVWNGKHLYLCSSIF